MSELPGRSVRVTRKFRRSDDAAYPSRRADTPVETFTLLTGSERKKSGIAPAFMPPTLLYSYRLTLQSSLDAMQSRAGLPSCSI